MASPRKMILPLPIYSHLLGSAEALRDLSDLIQKKYGCVVELRGPQTLLSQPEKVYEKRVFWGPVVSVWKGDLTREDAEVVVNAANEDLGHFGGLALALVKAGGPDIIEDSKRYIENNGKLKTSEVAPTRPGHLPCKSLLHAVGPVWFSSSSDQCCSDLTKCITNVLEYVEKTRSKSVAIPAISSGIFGFPLPLCAEVIVNTVRSFCYNMKSQIQEIRLVNHDDPTVQAMTAACEEHLGPTDVLRGSSASSSSAWGQNPGTARPVQPSEGHRGSSSAWGQIPGTARPVQPSEEHRGSSSPWGQNPGTARPGQPSEHHRGSSSSMQTRPNTRSTTGQQDPSTSTHKMPSSEMSLSVTISSLRLHLIQGLIQEQKTDIIVNSTSYNLDLNVGEISKAILQKAGQELQYEIRRQSQYNRVMIPTRSFQLPCAFVYHVILERSSLQVLDHVTKECLQTALHMKRSSISFPALGTGNIGLDKRAVAEAMTRTVVAFATESGCSMDVYFVIHPNDMATYQAFQNQLNLYRVAEKPPPAAEQRDERFASPNSEIPCLIINGSVDEDTEEAESWLKNMLHPQHIIIQNNLILQCGGKEHDLLSSLEVSIQEELNPVAPTLTISGPEQKRLRAALQAERLLLDVEQNYTTSLEEDLVEAAVIWFYGNGGVMCRYPAAANRELEKAYATQCDIITLQSQPRHVINIKTLAAEGQDGKFQLQRRTLHGNANNGHTRRQAEDWLSQMTAVDPRNSEFFTRANEFKKQKLTLLTMERIHNPYLTDIYQSKKAAQPKSAKKNIHQVYQLVPRQFIKQVCNVGFQSLYSNPKDPKYGLGNYFAMSPGKAVECFRTPEEDGFLYIFQAEAFTNKPTQGRKDMPILPKNPACSAKPGDVLDLSDSLLDYMKSPGILVLLSSLQANPQYLFTCKRLMPSKV